MTVTIKQTCTSTKDGVRLNAAELRSWSITSSVLTNTSEGLAVTYLFDNNPEPESARMI